MLKSKQLKWIAAVIVLMTTVGMVQITLNEIVYLPLVVAYATQTPTITPSPTVTQTPTRTPTATPAGVIFVEVVNSASDDPLDEYISIYNDYPSSIDLTGWFIRDDGPNRFDFPSNFYIASRRTVRIWTKEGWNTTFDLFWGHDTEVWNDFEDCAYLKDDSDGENLLIDIYCYVKNDHGLLVVTRMPDKIYP